MPRIFYAQDGSWGDAEGLAIVDVTDIEAIEMSEMSDSEIAALVAKKTEHLDLGHQRYSNDTGLFYTRCACGKEFAGFSPDEADSKQMDHRALEEER
jgi:hypothetical protein